MNQTVDWRVAPPPAVTLHLLRGRVLVIVHGHLLRLDVRPRLEDLDVVNDGQGNSELLADGRLRGGGGVVVVTGGARAREARRGREHQEQEGCEEVEQGGRGGARGGRGGGGRGEHARREEDVGGIVGGCVGRGAPAVLSPDDRERDDSHVVYIGLCVCLLLCLSIERVQEKC